MPKVLESPVEPLVVPQPRTLPQPLPVSRRTNRLGDTHYQVLLPEPMGSNQMRNVLHQNIAAKMKNHSLKVKLYDAPRVGSRLVYNHVQAMLEDLSQERVLVLNGEAWGGDLLQVGATALDKGMHVFVYGARRKFSPPSKEYVGHQRGHAIVTQGGSWQQSLDMADTLVDIVAQHFNA